MTEPADRIFRNAEVHTLAEPDSAANAAASEYAGRNVDEPHEAVAVRGGRVVRVGDGDEIGFLEGVATDVVDCEGGVLQEPDLVAVADPDHAAVPDGDGLVGLVRLPPGML